MSQLISFWPWLLILIILFAIILLVHSRITFIIVFTQINNHTHLRVGAQGLNKIVNIGLKSLYRTGGINHSDSLINETENINPLYSLPTIAESITLIHRFKINHLKKMQCEHLKWETQIGVNDPMGSAMLCGALWGIKYYFLGQLSGKFTYIEQPVIHIQPLYNHIHFNTELNCKIKVKFKQAIWIAIKLVWHLSQSRRKQYKLKKMTNAIH